MYPTIESGCDHCLVAATRPIPHCEQIAIPITTSKIISTRELERNGILRSVMPMKATVAASKARMVMPGVITAGRESVFMICIPYIDQILFSVIYILLIGKEKLPRRWESFVLVKWIGYVDIGRNAL
jgi:hypothetical protein